MSKTKYKVIEKKVERLEMNATDTCPECGSTLRVFINWGFEDLECMGCGYAETVNRTRHD